MTILVALWSHGVNPRGCSPLSQGWLCGVTVGSVVSLGMEPGDRGTVDEGVTLPLLPVHGERRREQGAMPSLPRLCCSSPIAEETRQEGGTDVLRAALLSAREESWELISVFIREERSDVFPPV